MTSQAISGVVDRAFTKTKSTRVGDKIINYVEVGGVTFSTGFKKVFSEGEMVNCAVKFNYGELQYQPNESPVGLPPATAGAPAPVNKGNFSGGNKSNYGNKGKFPIDPHDGQMSIIRQSSLTRAVEIMEQICSEEELHNMTTNQYMKELFEIALYCTDFASGNDIMQLKAAQQAARDANG